METIDTVTADQIEVGDFISVAGFKGEVLNVVDDGEHIMVTFANEALSGDRDELALEYWLTVDLLGD